MVGSSIILQREVEKNDTAKESWEFLKWWTSEETQLQYANDLKAVLGDAANYPASNLKAAQAIADELGYGDTISETLNWLREIPQVPGGYITGRNIENAFLAVVNNNLNPVDTLYSKVRYINTEIKNKRKEFDLDN
jgi:ABC-type glycerol-3-phosphate transport system substrate-binding protein